MPCGKRFYYAFCVRSSGCVIHHDPFQPVMSEWMTHSDDINPFVLMEDGSLNEKDARKLSRIVDLLCSRFSSDMHANCGQSLLFTAGAGRNKPRARVSDSVSRV